MVCFPPKISYSVCLIVWVRSNFTVHAAVRIIPAHEKWPTQGRPFSIWRSDIRKRKQTQFSRPMTGHTPQKLPRYASNLLHHRSAHCQAALGPYTRSNIVTLYSLNVKNFFRKNHKFSHVFSVITENSIVGAIHESPTPISNVNALFYCLLSSTMYAIINTQAKLNLVTGRKLYVSHSWRSNMYHFCRSFGFCNIGKSVKLA